MVREFDNGPVDQVSIPDRVIPMSLKMVLALYLLEVWHYKVGIKKTIIVKRR